MMINRSCQIEAPRKQTSVREILGWADGGEKIRPK